jgi:hypothetical protein
MVLPRRPFSETENQQNDLLIPCKWRTLQPAKLAKF